MAASLGLSLCLLLLASPALAQVQGPRKVSEMLVAIQPIYSCQININNLIPYSATEGSFPNELEVSNAGLSRYNLRFPGPDNVPILSDPFPGTGSSNANGTRKANLPAAAAAKYRKINYMAPVGGSASSSSSSGQTGVNSQSLGSLSLSTTASRGSSSSSSSSSVAPGRTSAGSFSSSSGTASGMNTASSITSSKPAAQAPAQTVRRSPPPPPPPQPRVTGAGVAQAFSTLLRQAPQPANNQRIPAMFGVGHHRHLMGHADGDTQPLEDLDLEVQLSEAEIQAVQATAGVTIPASADLSLESYGDLDDEGHAWQSVQANPSGAAEGVAAQHAAAAGVAAAGVGSDVAAAPHHAMEDVPKPLRMVQPAAQQVQAVGDKAQVEHHSPDEDEFQVSSEYGGEEARQWGEEGEGEDQDPEQEKPHKHKHHKKQKKKTKKHNDHDDSTEHHHHHGHKNKHKHDKKEAGRHSDKQHHHEQHQQHHQHPEPAEEAEDDEQGVVTHPAGDDSSSGRRQLQQTTSGAGATMQTACCVGIPTKKSNIAITQVPANPGNPKIVVGPQGFDDMGVNITDSVPMDPTLAVGRTNLITIINSVMRVYRVNAAGNVTGLYTQVTLPSFFNLVETCPKGVVFPAATYDKQIGRYLVTAVCAGTNRILLAASSSDTAEQNWWLYSLQGDFTSTPNGAFVCGDGTAVNPAYTQLTYNGDGVYITWYQDCITGWFDSSGAVLYALPKWAVYKGANNFWIPVYTAIQVIQATGELESNGWYSAGIRQLQPVMPQRDVDVYKDLVYFIGEPINLLNQGDRNNLLMVTLFNTGSLWLYAGPTSSSPAPLLVARIFGRGVDAAASADAKLQQPAAFDGSAQIDARSLNAGAVDPRGFWNGGAALYNGLIYVAQRGPDVADVYNTAQPSLYWAILQPSFCVSGPCAVYFAQDWGWDQGWNWNTGTWSPGTPQYYYAYGNGPTTNRATVTTTPGGNVITVRPASVGGVQPASGLSAKPASTVSAAAADVGTAAGAARPGLLSVKNSATGKTVMVSAANMSVAFGIGADVFFSGFGANLVNTYQSYYTYWMENYYMRNLYMNTRIPVTQNPCKLYANWYQSNTINFGVTVRNRGVIEYASPSVAGLNPLGLAYPQVAVRGGTMLIVYSYSGPFNVSLTNQWAFPGVGYTLIPATGPLQNTPTGQFNLLQYGTSYIDQSVGAPNETPTRLWGSYSGIDMQPGSLRIWSLVDYAQSLPGQAQGQFAISNAGTWLQSFN